MATVTRESLGNLHEKISVKVSKEDYMNAFNSSIKKLGKSVNIPGFRKGNVPKNMVQKMYGKSVFMDEVFKAVNVELDTYMREQELRIFGQPMVIDAQNPETFDFKNPSEYTFDFEVGLMPEVEIDLKKQEVEKLKIAISDSMIDEEEDNLRKRAGELVEKDALEEETDAVYIDYFLADQENEEALNEDVLEFSMLPEALKKELKGKGAGFEMEFVPSELLEEDEVESFVSSSLKMKEEGAADKKYKLVLKKAASLKVADLNEEFFEKVFPNAEIKDEEAFRARLKEEMQKETNRLERDYLQNLVYEALLENTEIEFPEAFLKRWLKESEGEEVKSDDEIEEKFPAFIKDLKWSLITDHFIKEYKVEVHKEEVENQVRMNAMQSLGVYNMEAAPWMESFIENMLSNEETLNQTYRQILIGRMFDALIPELKIKEKEVSLEDFQDAMTAKQAEAEVEK
ncbi:MAG TPA: trigger factor [Chitinophagaceae bacterium]|nr:trigger factor [Chitinophagaceae bacterium]